MRRWESIAVFTPLVGGAGFIAWALVSTYYENKARDAPAIAAGFHDASEMNAAKAVGMTDPAAYRARVEDEKAKAAAAKAARDKNMKAAEAEGAALLRERNRNPADRMTIKGMTWSLGGFKNVGVVSVTIENSNDFAVKDFGIRCQFSGKSGTQLSANNHIIFDTIPAKTKKAFKEVNVGFIDSQSATASCNVETAGRL
jgi:roadblock/LC7 domain-containing protein